MAFDTTACSYATKAGNDMPCMCRRKAKLDARVSRVMQVNRSLIDEVDDLRIGYVRAA